MSIRLNKERRAILKKYAQRCIFENNFKKTKFWHSFNEYKTNAGAEIDKFLRNQYSNVDPKAVNFAIMSVVVKGDISKLQLFMTRSYINVNDFLDRNFDYVHLNRLRLDKTIENEIYTIPLPTENPYCVNRGLWYSGYKLYPKNIEIKIRAIKNMIYDIGCFIHDNTQAYNLLINKRTTLKSLGQIWPEALKFEKEWEEQEISHKNINKKMTEEEAIKRIKQT